MMIGMSSVAEGLTFALGVTLLAAIYFLLTSMTLQPDNANTPTQTSSPQGGDNTRWCETQQPCDDD